MRKQRRKLDEFNISFLDVMSCGFGAIVLLLIIVRIGDPQALEQAERQLEGKVKEMSEQLFTIRGETTQLNRQLNGKQEQLSDMEQRIARLQEELASVKAQSRQVAQASTDEEKELRLALQVLNEEQQRLLGQNYRRQDNVVGGIPVDSEYIIFVIDTSGSMQAAAWAKLQAEMINILDVYPQVKGIQVMNDMGRTMFGSDPQEWLRDTEEMRQRIVGTLRTWRPFSNSSPAEGIESAIFGYYDPKKKISIYVMGDDFSGRSIKQVVTTVNNLNQQRQTGEKLVRVHAIGFPVHFINGNPPASAIRFANLMREISYQNGGTFIGLNNLN